MHTYTQQWTGCEPLLTKLLISQILAGKHPVCTAHSQWKHPHSAEPKYIHMQILISQHLPKRHL